MARPAAGDKILVLKERWLRLLLSGEKTLEIRGAPFKGGRYFLGCKSIVWGVATFGDPVELGLEEFRARQHQHLVEADNLPYKKTFGMPVLTVRALPQHPYTHPRGAIGIVKAR